MATPPTENTLRKHPTRLVFVGMFQLWAKLRLPLDVASVVPQAPKLPPGSGGELVMSNRPVVGDRDNRQANGEGLNLHEARKISRQGFKFKPLKYAA